MNKTTHLCQFDPHPRPVAALLVSNGDMISFEGPKNVISDDRHRAVDVGSVGGAPWNVLSDLGDLVSFCSKLNKWAMIALDARRRQCGPWGQIRASKRAWDM